jgi:hypothetical protein
LAGLFLKSEENSANPSTHVFISLSLPNIMFLTLKNVVPYLLECGLVHPETIVNGEVMIVATPRRNLNFKIVRKRGEGLFVKQIQVWNAQTSAEMQREAACYWLPGQDEAFEALRTMVPKYKHYDSARAILITELLPDGENLSDYHRRLGNFPVEAGEALGSALASYHRITNEKLAGNKHLAMFPKMPPWILSVHQTRPGLFNDLSKGNAQMIGVVQQYPDFQRTLDHLRVEWQTTSLIHGDMKWDNCIVEKPADSGSSFTLRVVDWELADIGDAAWDAGAIFQAYLSWWIFSINAPAGMPPAQSLHLARYRIESMHPAIRRFWESYCEAMGLTGADAGKWLERSVRYAAARMIQTVYEHAQQASQLAASGLCLLQVSMNILLRPQEAICELLAL